MSFRLTTILWVFALLAAAMATFGPWGIFAALGVAGFWAQVFSGKRLTILELCVILAIIGILAGLLIPFDVGRETSRRVRCTNNLVQIATAVRGFAANLDGRLPPVSAPMLADGSPQSWRLRLLPRLDQRDAWDRYQHLEPWNSSGNQWLSQSPIDVYQCPSDVRASNTSPHTSYFAVVGEETAWPPDGGRRLADFTDGLDQTILLLEAPGRDVSWAEPRDLTVDEAVAFLTDPDAAPNSSPVHLSWGGNGFFYHQFAEPRRGVHVAFANGRVAFLPLPINRDLAEALMTVDGGEDIADELDRLMQPKLNYAKIYAFAVFVLLALLPAARLFGLKHAPPSNAPAG